MSSMTSILPDIRKGLVKKPPIDFRAGLVAKPAAKPEAKKEAAAKPTHPAGEVTGFDEQTGLPIVKRHVISLPAEGNKNTPVSTIGKEDPKTDRTVLHASNDADKIQEAAKAEHPNVKKAIRLAIHGIEGAKLHGDRDEKPEERTQEKIEEEGQPAKTIPDFSGFRVSVTSDKAHGSVADAIRKHFNVVKEKDEFKDGAPDTKFHAHMMQVQMPESKVSHEVQVLPKPVADAAEATHETYEKARGGDKDAADKMKAHNEAAYKEFEDGQHKYKFGNTQVNLPEGSDAHKAILAAQKSIPDEDLAGDGKDVDHPHVTVRYGIKGDKLDNLRKFIGQQKPFTAKLGKTASFKPSEHSDGAAPIIAPAHAPELHSLNAEIQKHADFEPSSFPDYKPHVTVAYVKPEAADKHAGNSTTEGKTFPVSSISISDRDGNKEDVPMLGGQSGKEGGRGESPEQTAGGSAGVLPPAALKVGDAVKLKDGRRATVAYAPSASSQLPMYRFKTADGKTVEIRKRDVMAGAAVLADPSWVGFDLDKTLSKYDGHFKGPTVIGAPVPKMVERAKQHIANGDDVRIMSARMADDKDGKVKKAIGDWTEKHIGKRLEATDRKDSKMKVLYDDRARQVVPNEGTVVGERA